MHSNKQQSVKGFQLNFVQAVLRLVDIGEVFVLWNGHQAAIHFVSPAVVRTANNARAASLPLEYS